MIRVYRAICTGCGACVETCPQGAISLVQERAKVDQARCIECGACLLVCGTGALHEMITPAPLRGPEPVAPYPDPFQRVGTHPVSWSAWDRAAGLWSAPEPRRRLTSGMGPGVTAIQPGWTWNWRGRRCRRRFRGGLK